MLSKLTKKELLIAVVSAALLFCWLEVRPSVIRQRCQALAYDRGNDYFDYDFIQDETALKKSQLQEEYMERTYVRCLHENGLRD